MDFLKKIFSSQTGKAEKIFTPLVLRVNDFSTEFKALSAEDFPKKTLSFKERIASGEALESLLPEAFALVREAAERTLGERHYDVQILAGAVLNQGAIAEMRTGEGKTLVATLPVYLNALGDKGVHVVTVNDYLARRDAVWMGQIYAYLGLSLGVINHDSAYLYDQGHAKKEQKDELRDAAGSFKVVYDFLRPASRKEAYLSDITYGTNNEFAFDYLRDNLATVKENLVQRGHSFAIVDEVDSILIDEARTPLIISAPAEESADLYQKFSALAEKMVLEKDYLLDEKDRAISLTEIGIEKAEKLLGLENLYTEASTKAVHHLETAIRAKALFWRDRDYVVKDNQVVIVDEFTGRLQPGRRWSDGLHQAIEAKEGVKVEKESRTVASITFQNYFRFYQKISGMTGTAKTSKEEFEKVYKLEVLEIPTHRQSQRKDHADLIFQTERGKWQALAKRVKELHRAGQPVLLGTVSIEKNELLSAYLTKEGIPHTILNAKNHEAEGEIIAQAGRRGAVTIATNMAGRGVDIKLGGAPASEEKQKEVISLGGLFVIGTERHDARRIDNQLRGRAGRQGDPGETQFYVSLEDTLMRIFASDPIKKMMGRFGIPEDEPIAHNLISRGLEKAQEKIEGLHFDARKHVLEYDTVLNQQRESVYRRRRGLLLGEEKELLAYLDFVAEDDQEFLNFVSEKRKLFGEETFFDFLRRVALETIDRLFMEHLEAMEYLRSSVNLRAYGQRDPLVEYKREALIMYRELEKNEKIKVRAVFSAIEVPSPESPLNERPLVLGFAPDLTEKQLPNTNTGERIKEKFDQKEVSKGLSGRNDPCPCGSGKKWKKCHGK